MIGRKKEIAELEELYLGNQAELVAVYGRRRVGKTYMIEQTFKDRFAFRHAGLSPVEHTRKGMLEAQLQHFYNSLRSFGLKDEPCPTNWLDAFFLLQQLLERHESGERLVVFIDELPWLDTPRSGFMTAFEGFWNNWGSRQDQLMMIVCGSANSWMLDKLINNHGGLYGRVTYEIQLAPFSLRECEEYLKSKRISYSRYDIAQASMIVGGIPFYLKYFRRGLSLAQNIDALFFQEGAKLQFEYDRLFTSVFSNPGMVKAIVALLYTRNGGYTRKEITTALHIKDGGTITSCLNALMASGFVLRYVPFGMKGKQEHYRLIDPFCIFYLRFVQGRKSTSEQYWAQHVQSQPVVTWRGFAFENLCFRHVRQIKSALGIGGVASTQSTWSRRSDDGDGAQIDMLIIRDDDVINLCEMKFYGGDFTVTGDDYRKILRKQELLSACVPRRYAIQSTLVTSFGLMENEYSGVFSLVVTLDDLFAG